MTAWLIVASGAYLVVIDASHTADPSHDTTASIPGPGTGDMVDAHHCHHSSSTATSTHAVQFYDEEDYLHSVLSDYFAPFLADGEDWLGGMVLGRARTTSFLRDCLLARGYMCDGTADNDEPRGTGGGCDEATLAVATYRKGERRVLLVDADSVVARLVLGNELKAGEFDKMLGELFLQLNLESSSDSQQRRHEAPIHAYGELVDILCARGQHLLALDLEALWNRALDAGNISLLCGYKMDSFHGLQVEKVFDHICNSHGAVAPTEMYSSLATMEQKLAMVAALQQKATVLRSKQPVHGPSREAEQRIRHREQYVDMLCHELRNPVGAVVGNVELLQVGLDVRQAILRPHGGGRGDDDYVLSNADVVSLRDQLADDFVSVEAIAACAEHMKTVSDDVLALSKLQDGKVILEKVPFDPRATVTSVIRMFSTLAHKKGIKLVEDLPTEKLLVVGDQGRLAQVIVNLLSNAVKFTDTGSITVQLRSLGPSLINCASTTFKVVVRDTGRGLSQDEISMLFQRFAQPPTTSFTRDGGTGLGLYISKYLVELMGGVMYVESLSGNGSAFIFTFLAEEYSPAEKDTPRLPQERAYIDNHSHTAVRTSHLTGNVSPPAGPIRRRPAMSRRVTDSSPSTLSASSLASSVSADASARQHNQQVRHVLVVDDNPIILRTLTRILECISGLTLSISTASNGYEAISKLIALSTSTSPIDLILMDLEMPYMDGLKAASEIRGLDNHYPQKDRPMADTPIIGMTADIREEQFAKARHNGMDDCIKKPVVKATLLELMDRVARRRMEPVQ